MRVHFKKKNIPKKIFPKIGIAIYAAKKTKVSEIFKKVGNKPDFIHVDIVDKTFFKNSDTVDLNVYKHIKRYWKKKEVHTHFMTKKPFNYIKKTTKYSDIIFIHNEISNKPKIINFLKKSRKTKMGIVLHSEKNYDKNIKKITSQFSNIMVLCISKPGYSGQPFSNKSYKIIKKINKIITDCLLTEA